MGKVQPMKYKKEYIFLPSLSGLDYPSPVPHTWGRADPAWVLSLKWDHIHPSSPYPLSSKTPTHPHLGVLLESNCVRPEEPRPVEFNMNFYCYGKVFIIQTYIKLEFINPFKTDSSCHSCTVSDGEGLFFSVSLISLFCYMMMASPGNEEKLRFGLDTPCPRCFDAG